VAEVIVILVGSLTGLVAGIFFSNLLMRHKMVDELEELNLRIEKRKAQAR